MRHVHRTEVLWLVCPDDVPVFGEVHPEQHYLVIHYMHSSDLIEGFPLLAKVPVLNVDPCALVTEKELL